MFQHRDCPKLDTTNILSEIMDRNHKMSGAPVSRTFYEATLTKTWVLLEKSSTKFRWIYGMFEQVSIHSMVQAMKMGKTKRWFSGTVRRTGEAQQEGS